MLLALVLVPLVGAVAAAVLGRGGATSARLVGLVGALATLGVAVAVTLSYDHSGSGMQLTTEHEWIGPVGAHLALGVDGLALVMVLLTVVLVPIVLVAEWRTGEADGRTGSFAAWVLGLEAAALAVFLATDVFLFYVVFEATLIPAYFLVGGFGGPGRARAATKFLVYQLAGGLVMLLSVVGLYVVSAQQGAPSYLVDDLAALDLSEGMGRWLFLGFFVAFAVKAPLFPVHTWLADTTQAATPGTSVLLICILDKIGTYGMIRFCLGLFPEASVWATPAVVTLALISIVYGALVAIGQDDLLRLVGLTSLSHFGFIVLGIFVLTDQGHTGAILYMVNHGIATAALFLVAGFAIRRSGTASIAAMGGMEKAAPVLAGLFLVAGMATLGLPGLAPFVSEFLVTLAAFDYAWYAGAIAVTGIVLAAVYVLWAYQRTMTGPLRGTPVVAGDLDRREVGVLVPLVVALVGLGFFPSLLTDVVEPTTQVVLEHVGEHGGPADDGPDVPAADSEQGGR
ncbi:NADH-quinone oxidoreductase subunit M [Nocardioides sp. CPCC 205120]|uniref:NADH-quinone oxidoreductase subunit M n=1 Tax=Nocardioides sp. CPCC 205120 TaxID=3406462 RepID=UPI003B50EEB7